MVLLEYEGIRFSNGPSIQRNYDIVLKTREEASSLVSYYSNITNSQRLQALTEHALRSKQRLNLITHILPEFVRLSLGQPGRDGANCFNTTLMFHDLAYKVEHINRENMTKQLQENFRPLRSGETLKPGDVAVFISRYGLDHTAVYIGNHLFFQKASSISQDLYTIETYDNLSASYRGHGDFVSFFRKK